MSRRAFWPKEGVRRQVPGTIDGEMWDAEVTEKEIRFFKRGSQICNYCIDWAVIFSNADFPTEVK